MIEKLVSIGFTENEANVYLALRRIGQTKVGPLVKETGLHRTLVYRALATLEERRLVTKVLRGSVSAFQATSPEHLLDAIEEKKRSAEDVVERLKRESAVADQEIVVYEGVEGVRAAVAELPRFLNEGEEYFVLGSGGEIAEAIIGPRGIKNYIAGLGEKNVKMRILSYQSRELSEKTMRAMHDAFELEEKVIPREGGDAVPILFGDAYVWILLYEEPYTVIRIHNPTLARMKRNYFELVWEQAAYAQRGHEAFEQMHWQMLAELEPGDTYHVLGASIDPNDRRTIAFFKLFHDRRVKKGVGVKMLSYKESVQIRKNLETEGDIQLELCEVRPFPRAPRSPLQVNLFNGKAMMMTHGREPMVMLFDCREVYEGFQSYFDELWDQRAMVYTGEEGVSVLVNLVLSTGGVMHVLASNGGLAQFETSYKKIEQASKNRDIDLRMLVSKAYRGKTFTQIKNARVRFIAPELEAPMAVWVFGDTVATINWEAPQTVLILEDAEAAERYRAYYKRMELRATI